MALARPMGHGRKGTVNRCCRGHLSRRLGSSDAAHTFIYDGWNVVLELVEHDNVTDRIEYYWGKDISGSLQGAGGVGGLLYLKRNGAIYVPFYDAYGNVMGYRDAEGNTVAEYVYDAFGRTVAQNGTMADVFAIRYSTKYYDAEVGLYYYGKRHYSPVWRRWLTRDPIGEGGGVNLYCYVGNAPVALYDAVGLYKVIYHTFGTPPPVGWSDKSIDAYFSAKFRYPIVRQISYNKGRIGYSVDFNPKESIFEIFTRLSVSIGAIADEADHLNCAIPYDAALGVFKTEAEAICDCPKMAKKRYNDVAQKLKQAEVECKACNWRLDRKGGPHGH